MGHSSTFKETIERCQQYNIAPAFAYATFSSIKNNKFRVVFVLEHEVADIRVRNLVQLALMRIFPECDKACKDPSRLFFGGKERIYCDYDARINVPELIDKMVVYIYSKDENNNSSRTIKEFCKSVGVNTVNGLPDVKYLGVNDVISENDVNTPSPLIYYRICGNNVKKAYRIIFGKETITSPDKKKYNITNTKEPRVKVIRNYNWEQLEEDCMLYKGHINGTYWSYHPELFGMATNLLAIECGREKLSEGLAKNEEYDINKWNAIFNYINKRNYAPQQCDNFCPFKEECEHGLNMLLQGKIPRGQVNVCEQPVLISLKDAETKLTDKYKEILATGELGKIHCIKAPTGIGKTELYLDAKDTTIAQPTHKLKAEVYQRCLEVGNDVAVTPELPKIIPAKDKKIIDHYYSIGAYTEATLYITKLAEKYPELRQYLIQMEEALKTVGRTLLTTHQKLMFLPPDSYNETVIIDEDIFRTLFPIDSVDMADLKSLENEIFLEDDTQETIDNLLKLVVQGKTNIVYEMPNKLLKGNTKVYKSIISNSKINTNILGFFGCNHFIKYFTDDKKEIIKFISKRELPLNKKIIIMSATLNEQICKLAFGDRMVWFDIGEVELKGRIIQYPQMSFSRTQVKSNEKLLNMARGIIGDKPIITYRCLIEELSPIATYGATEGLDTFSGLDIAVVGTPNVNPIAYLLYAHVLGLKPESNDSEMTYTKIKRNGFEYYFNTYDEPLLREIQMYLIESELLQAIGRARISRNDCTVTVFSNLPIHQAVLKYLTKEEWDIANLKGKNYRQE